MDRVRLKDEHRRCSAHRLERCFFEVIGFERFKMYGFSSSGNSHIVRVALYSGIRCTRACSVPIGIAKNDSLSVFCIICIGG